MSILTRTYRVYCYDAAQVTVFAEEIDARSDEEAIALAESADYGSRCEIWDGDRLVAELDVERRQA